MTQEAQAKSSGLILIREGFYWLTTRRAYLWEEGEDMTRGKFELDEEMKQSIFYCHQCYQHNISKVGL